MAHLIDLTALVSAIGDAIVVCDKGGAITLWNPAAERMFGFTEAEALGQSLDIIIPERMRKRHWDGYYHSMETGTTKYGHDVLRVPAVDKAGRALSISFTVAMLFGADGKAQEIASVMRDETAAFNKNRDMRKRLAELEALVATGHAAPASDVSAVLDDDAPATAGCPVHKA